MKVNVLDEVTISQYSLSGELEKYLEGIPTYEQNLPLWGAAELKHLGVDRPNDSQSPVQNLVLPEIRSVRTTVNLWVLREAVGGFLKSRKKNLRRIAKEIEEVFSEKLLVEKLKIPETNYYDFLDFSKEQPQTVDVIKARDELKSIEYVLDQYQIFTEK